MWPLRLVTNHGGRGSSVNELNKLRGTDERAPPPCARLVEQKAVVNHADAALHIVHRVTRKGPHVAGALRKPRPVQVLIAMVPQRSDARISSSRLRPMAAMVPRWITMLAPSVPWSWALANSMAATGTARVGAGSSAALSAGARTPRWRLSLPIPSIGAASTSSPPLSFAARAPAGCRMKEMGEPFAGTG